MEEVFVEVSIQRALAKTIDNIGTSGFWQYHRSLMNSMGSIRNSLVIFFEANEVPQVLSAHCTHGLDIETVMGTYLNGLYLLDPFYQACCAGMQSGMYRLEEVAPDRFLQSEYFTSYFSETVGRDEVQLILALGERRYLSVSLGFDASPGDRLLGRLAFYSDTLLALMRQHWIAHEGTSRAKRSAPAEQDVGSELKIEQALERFGAGLLSSRELETARLILRGNSSKAISSQLNISLDTVKAHRRHLYSKLGINSQPELFNIFLKALD